MKHRIKSNRRKLIRTFIQYGLHLWLIIFICNVVVIYAVRFFLFASTDTTSVTSPTTLTFMPKPTGPAVSVDLVLPGIGSKGGNLKPLHPVRDISVNLYGTDSNTSDNKVKPIYSIKTKVNFDADPNSPTYTQFINPHVDLGAITSGNYQVSISTSQTLSSVIKEAGSSSLSGKIYNFSNNPITALPLQIMISGDIYPAENNDNIMDINDYNMLVDCFSNNINAASKCPNVSADLDDNGVVDGTDYNIMLLSFRSLKFLGYPIPAIVVPTPIVASPTMTIPVSNVQKQTITPIQKQIKSSGNGGVFIILLVVLLILGIVAFIFFKLHLLKFLFKGVSPVSQNNENFDESSAKENLDIIEKSVYLKKTSTESQTNGTWVTLADDNGVIPGLYTGKNVTEGFVKIKGTMKTDKNNKQYILISEIKEEK